ncbi:hypothetical protein [Gracilibacillus alcaliphilus]|uniref:hypothetical protein n=1 Tax=Gracilibacillus alcaliphilus TaxID=1401441 RepID=UPI00195B75F1|nr:hypothetical protein [Gracilibacillus alcaliphilus]MBM7679258.1 putative DNA-binding transcriptional regulator YafY [Gracilibacillus alcaliphilus]
MMGLLTNSLEKKGKIMIYYMDNQNIVTQRIVRVIKVEDNRLIAYCYYRQQVRSFKIDNILSCGSVKGRVGA